MMFLRLFGLYLRLGAINELQYRSHLFVQLAQSVIGLVTSLIGLSLVFSKTDQLAGWSSAELLAVIGVYFLMRGALEVVVRPSLSKFMEDVRLGTLDFTLVKPADAQLLASIRQVEVWKLIDVALGFAVIAVAIIRLEHALGLGQSLIFVIALLAGGAMVYSFLVILATCSFWWVRLENILVIFQSMYEAGRWPVSIYPIGMRAILTFLVPIGFAITVPAEGLVGRLSWTSLLGALALAVALPAAARWFWRRGLRQYSGASA